jgi:hypothetical protein
MQVIYAGNNLAKKHISCPLRLIWDFLGFFAFVALNQNIRTQLCMNMKNTINT